MIKSHHFNDAYQQYNQQKITFRLLQDQAAVLIGLCETSYPSVRHPLKITHTDIDWLLHQPEATQNYSNFLGGNVFVCETEDDLLQIHGCNFEWAEEHNGQWPNVTDVAMSWDACSYLDEVSGDSEWVIFMLCWSNAGGPVYYVPKHLWIQARVNEHIEATT
ncbi:hypothetical protein [Methylotenera sp.]|uniref:hypothetical protein n=1 Tax=Methylotenera sp. TaxID=2051956 RepID=UPI002735F4D0|nr:hypothetical protein [Methylotenera sp.]MDP3005301.1 hypothetical protein [Methylotenera sp.]